MINEKSCGAVVYKFKENGLFFLVEHMVHGHTSIPKGHMEGNETEEETAIREIREETGLEVRLDTVFRHAIYYSPGIGIMKEVVFFAAEAVSGDMRNQECEVISLEWLPYDKAIEVMTYDTDKDVLSHAAVYLSIKLSWQRIDMKSLYLSESGSGLWYREHAVDIHGHIMPGIDDGAETGEETVEMLHMAWDQGVRTVFATPHFGIENGYDTSFDDYWFGANRLMDATRYIVPYMDIVFGAEIYCSDDIVNRIREIERIPLIRSDWHMVEFLEWGRVTEPADVILRRLKVMRDNKIKTILAHPERYRAIRQDWDLAKRICDLGVLLQVNAYDLFLNENEKVRSLAQWMAQEELISFIGSDMHGTREGSRPPRVQEGIRWLYENVDDEYANEIVRMNAEKYLGVRKLDMLKSAYVERSDTFADK